MWMHDEVLLEVNTFEFIREVDKLNNPKEQQQKLADMAAYASIRNESVIRAWGYSSPIVRNYVRKRTYQVGVCNQAE